MKRTQQLTLVGLAVALVVALSGCDMAEQAGRELAAKAEESARQMAQEAFKESLDTLNEKVDQAQKNAETWIGKPPASSEQVPEEARPVEPPAAPDGMTIET